jgi:tetrapyrrole methylase family protein / MazG family protein
VLKKLVLVGVGIKTISHLTIESQAYIKNAEYVLYLINEPILEEWLKKNSKKSASLEHIYFFCYKRKDSYNMIIEEILSSLDTYNYVTVVLYGHPTFFSFPGLEAVKIASKRHNIETLILPAISAQDCLLADLRIDAGENGMISVEAMSFIVFKRVFSPFYDLILWQLGAIGNISSNLKNKSVNGLRLVMDKLLIYYPKDHEITLYEASMYPGVPCKIKKFSLQNLLEQDISTITTVYVPALDNKIIDHNVLNKLGLTIEDL